MERRLNDSNIEVFIGFMADRMLFVGRIVNQQDKDNATYFGQ
jgi:hypothetical protein